MTADHAGTLRWSGATSSTDAGPSRSSSEFDDQYWEVFREHEQRVRTKLVGGRRHVFEAEMKERRRTHGLDGHEASPPGPGME